MEGNKQSDNSVKNGILQGNADNEDHLIQIQHLENQVVAMRQRAETAEWNQQTTLQEYDRSRKDVKQLQSVVESVSQTNNVLKKELSEQEDKLEQAKQLERKRADKEIARIRDSMLSVLEKERQIMRSEITNALSDVKSFMNNGLN